MRSLRVAGLSLFVLLASIGAAPSPGNTITVVGQDDIAVDRQAIQGAIDAAGDNTTIRLVGTFQLDGTQIIISKGNLTIEGQRFDSDGDGKVNEDWADGLDNDFDGSIDEDGWDTVLRGLTNPDGTPDEGPGIRSLFNRGMEVTLIEGQANQITIRDLKFESLVRGIGIGPDVRLQPGFFCDEVIFTGGQVKNAVIERNLFENVTRGAQIFGESHNVRISDNILQDVVRDSFGGGGQGILLVGEAVFCVDSGGNDSFVLMGTPVNTQIGGNLVIRAGNRGIAAFADQRTSVTGNEVRDTLGNSGILFGDSSKIQVQHNTVIGGGCCGVSSFGANPGAQVQNNTVADVWSGILFAGSDGRALNNTTINVTFDYNLEVSSSNNTLILKPGQTCRDDGVNNSVRGGSCTPGDGS